LRHSDSGDMALVVAARKICAGLASRQQATPTLSNTLALRSVFSFPVSSIFTKLN
jgi:hypothetical protein